MRTTVSEPEPGSVRPPSHPGLRYALVASVPFALVCLWRSPLAAAYRPAIMFGSPWGDIARAWMVEGFFFGIAFLIAQRVFSARKGPLSGMACVLHLALWMLVWALGVVVPGAAVLDGFAAYVAPLKEVLRVGGLMGGVLAGGMALVYALICLVVVVIEFVVATLWFRRVAPTMARMAAGGKAGRSSTGRPGPTFGTVVLTGAAFWGIRLAIIGIVEEPFLRGVLDASVVMAIIGIVASFLARPMMSEAPPSA